MVMQLEWLTVIYSTITIFLIIHQHPNNYNGISIIILVHGTVYFSTFFLDIGGMQIARQMSLLETPSALSENSESNILRSYCWIRPGRKNLWSGAFRHLFSGVEISFEEVFVDIPKLSPSSCIVPGSMHLVLFTFKNKDTKN